MRFFLRLLPLSLILFLMITSCKLIEKKDNTKSDKAIGQSSSFPSWVMQSNIYEVNVRQYTPEGTFKAFEAHLQRLKDMGVDILWFMPITPISKVDSKGVLGSYYAVADYKAINPEFGNMDDWNLLVKKCHDLGMKVIIDWVPNHSGADNNWLQTHPDFYNKDSSGKPVYAFDWSDTRDLNYWNPVLQDSMIDAMKYWLSSGIDGFRCDVAAEVPRFFWEKCIKELKSEKSDLFFLAEGDKGWLHDAGFHASYPWDMFSIMKKVALGIRPAISLDSVLMRQDESFPIGATRMYFTSNHDENSWNKSDYGTFPGVKHAPFAVFTQTMRNSLPLIYSGQEEPFLDSLSFFYKDTIVFDKFKRAPFYKTLLNLRKKNPALAIDGDFKKINTNKDDKVYAYMREKNGNKVLVILNFSPAAVTVNLSDNSLKGTFEDVFQGKLQNFDPSVPLTLDAWGYLVYSYKN
ncbi:MAG TPA: alpha-amylase family glycosyl hydrolase [Chitinophagaceae bacterium]|nr:alpha-amylase family glycosyl hydrolase [Chitinophagaceae bacterium]